MKDENAQAVIAARTRITTLEARLDGLMDALGDWSEFVVSRKGALSGTEYNLITLYRATPHLTGEKG